MVDLVRNVTEMMATAVMVSICQVRQVVFGYPTCSAEQIYIPEWKSPIDFDDNWKIKMADGGYFVKYD